MYLRELNTVTFGDRLKLRDDCVMEVWHTDRCIIRFLRDGKVEFSPDYRPAELARDFWMAVGRTTRCGSGIMDCWRLLIRWLGI